MPKGLGADTSNFHGFAEESKCSKILRNSQRHNIRETSSSSKFYEYHTPLQFIQVALPIVFVCKNEVVYIYVERLSFKEKFIRIWKKWFLSERHWWDFLMILTMIGMMLFVPYQAAFDMDRSDVYHWTIAKNFFLVLCCIDILINFMTG